MDHSYNESDAFSGLYSIRDFPSLKQLILDGRDYFQSLPEQLQRITDLEILVLSNFQGLKALPEWLGNLSCLTRLRISNCDNLKYLPKAKAMQRLNKLRNLEIDKCPLHEKNLPMGEALSGPRFLIFQKSLSMEYFCRILTENERLSILSGCRNFKFQAMLGISTC